MSDESVCQWREQCQRQCLSFASTQQPSDSTEALTDRCQCHSTALLPVSVTQRVTRSWVSAGTVTVTVTV